MKKLLTLVLLLCSSAAIAADNGLVVTNGAGVTLRSKDVGVGVQAPSATLVDTTGAFVGNFSNFGTSPGAVTVPAFNAASFQIGTWTIQPGNTPNTTPWLVQGNVSNATSAVATSSIQVPAVSYLYGFNGATWDQVQVDGSKNLKVNCTVGCSSSGGSSLADAGTFTQATTSFTVVGGLYNTAIINLASGQAGASRLTLDRQQVVMGGLGSAALTQWTSATTINTTQTITIPVSGGPAAIVVQFVTNGGTATGGAITFEGSFDNTTFITLSSLQLIDPTSTTLAVITNPWTVINSTTKPFMILPLGMQSIRLRLSTAITGTVTFNGTATLVSSDVANAVQNSIIATGVGSAIPPGANTIGNVNVLMNGATPILDPCQTGTPKTSLPISQNTAGGVQLFAGGASKKNYICAIALVAATAEQVSLVEGTGSVCATSPVALIGATTAANGLSFAANGGITYGSGGNQLAAGAVNANNVCLLQVGTARVSGVITYVQQ